MEPRQIGAAFFSRRDPSDAAVCFTERRAADVVMMAPPLRGSRNNKTQTFGSFLKTPAAEKLQRSRCTPPPPPQIQRFLLCVKLHSSAFLPDPPPITSDHLVPPSKDLRLTDNCNSLHSRLCLLTSHESSFGPVHCGRFASSPTLACLARAELPRRASFFSFFFLVGIRSGNVFVSAKRRPFRGAALRFPPEREKSRATQRGDGFDLRGTDRATRRLLGTRP